MIKFVIDTNFFVNLQRDLGLGENKEAVIESFISYASPLVSKEVAQFLTTPDALHELESFFDGTPQTLLPLRSVLTISSPNLTGLSFDATLFERLVAEIGTRLYKGLRAAEEYAKNPPLNDGENPLRTLRDKYRRTTREGFLDSTTDFGLIMLSRERDASLVSSDAGLRTWARLFGCTEMLPEEFVKRLISLR